MTYRRSAALSIAVALVYLLALRFMIASEVAMAILSSGGHFPAWAILAALTVLLLRVVVFVVLPAAIFAKLAMDIADGWPRTPHFLANFRRK